MKPFMVLLNFIFVISLIEPVGGYFWGQEYWNGLYSGTCINSYENWRGWWNFNKKYDGYGRPKVTGKSDSGCSIENSVLSCAEASKKSIHVKWQGTFTSIGEDAFKEDVEEIKIEEEQLKEIHPNTFKKLTKLTILEIRHTKLNHMPDISNCEKLEEIDFYDNEIEIHRHNYTTLPKSLKWIILIKNRIYKFPTGYFDLPELQYLALAKNVMMYFPWEAFKDNPKLEYLGVDDNKITSISQIDLSTVADYQRLKHVNMSNNQISYIAPKALKQLKQLCILELHTNHIAELPNYAIWKIPELVHLDLFENKLKILSSDFITDCPKLKNLYLHSQTPAMEVVYFDSMRKLNSIEYITLGSNALSNFPHPVFSEENWPTLKTLELDNNKISTLRDYSNRDFSPSTQLHHLMKEKDFKPFKTLSGISTLRMQKNSISEIRETDLEFLTSLSSLDLGNNLLSDFSIHESAFQNTSIETLILSNQKGRSIQYVPKIFSSDRGLVGLTKLYLDSNKITYIENGTFLPLVNLKKLYIGGNNILTIEDDSFPSSLTYLDLSSNKFRFTNYEQFKTLPNLETLTLSHNEIKVIPEGAFQGVVFTTLKLDNNKIGRLMKAHFKDSHPLTTINFESNKITFIEDGTLAWTKDRTVRFEKIDLDINELSRVPRSDFWNNEIKILRFDNNRIARIPRSTFVNFTFDEIFMTRNRIERLQQYAFHNIVCKRVNLGGQKSTNKLQVIESHAFENVHLNYLDLSYHFVKILPPYALNVRGLDHLWLNNGHLELIETSALNLGVFTGNVELNTNQIKTIQRKIFVRGTRFKDLYIMKNKITSIDDYAFEGATISGTFNANQNELAYFPASALAPFKDMKKIFIKYNKILSMSVGSLDPFTKLEIFDFGENEIKKLENNLFSKNTLLKEVWFENNKKLTTIEDHAFNNTYQLKTISGYGCFVEHVPKFEGYTKLEILKFSNVKTVAPKFILDNTPVWKLALYTKFLQCECAWYETITTFLEKRGTLEGWESVECAAPDSLKGFKSFNKISPIENRKSEFICIPTNIQLSAPMDYTIQIDYHYPAVYYPSGPAPSVTNDDIYVDASCTLEDGTGLTLTASVLNKRSIIISGNDVMPGRVYKCYLIMTYDKGKTGSNTTSARSPKLSATTIERKGKATLCDSGDKYECQQKTTQPTCTKDGCDVTASNVMEPGSCDAFGCCTTCFKSCFKCNDTVKDTTKIDVKYLDFRSDDNDFNQVKYFPDNFVPKYMPSPYETWLTKTTTLDPAFDSFSEWFRSTSSRNIAVDGTITLSSEEVIDPVNSKAFYTFWNGDYWPVNGKGYGAQGQKDCTGKELLNFGFTSTIRTGITFTGEEHFQFGGGEDLWVFVNGVLVLQVILIEQSANNQITPCKTFQLRNATGSGIITPRVGVVDPTSKTCITTTEATNETVTLKLKVNLNYRLEIFHVERSRCNSQFLFTASGVQFISSAELTTTKPVVDYIFEPPEDENLKAIVGTILLSDLYETIAPYKVTIESGNEEERFEIVENSTQAHIDSSVKPVPRVYENITLNGEVIIICPNTALNTSAGIPKTNLAPQVFQNLNTPYALILLKQGLDFEATSSYLLRIKVEDSKGHVGRMIVQILVVDKSDNCPIIKQKTFSTLVPIPPLQQEALITVQATDADSGDNGRISYIVDEVAKIPTLKHQDYLIWDEDIQMNKTVWVNTTTEYMVRVNVYAVDNGSPRRGDFFSISLVYAPNCDKRGRVIINETSGALNFFAPGMTIYNESKFRRGKEECYECTAGFFCPGDSREISCVQDAATKYHFSFGFASKCSSCPEGWLCHNGVIIKCAPNTYVKCNDSWCPDKCFPCVPGTYCDDGIQYDCREGTYGDGKGPCQLCRPGSFSNTTRASQCTCCPSGYDNTYSKTGCRECHNKEYSTGNCTTCVTCWPPGVCGCDSDPCYRGVSCANIGGKGSSFQCGACPRGYVGDGKTCQDIDECNEKPCYNETQCKNISPGYHCSGCPPGFSGNAPSGVGLDDARKKTQTCADIDECKTADHLCDPNAECINTPGSYKCGKCKPGFVGDGYVGCKSGDYCASGVHDCHQNATCIPLGSQKYHCECKDGYAGNGRQCDIDHDYDGITSFGAPCIEKECKKDRCPYVPNSGQEDYDQDTLGDVCDQDDDDDNIDDIKDNCQFKRGRDQTDADKDDVGNICDNCPSDKNTDQKDRDGDGIGDVCDDDIDGDGIKNANDNCKYLNITNNNDQDGDGFGDECDNCKDVSNGNQDDVYQSGYGDACNQPDKDRDSIPDRYDNCPQIANAEQSDKDKDGKGDLCDDDKDGDGVNDEQDNCVYVRNPQQQHTINYDMEANPVGTSCVDDYDGDGIKDGYDVCPLSSNIPNDLTAEYTEVDLSASSSTEPKPRWRIRSGGRDIEQLLKTYRPSMLIGEQRYSDFEYTGVVHVNGDASIDYLGIVFGYQNTKTFYVAMWRHQNMNYLNTTYKAGIKGIQLKAVHSRTGPGDDLSEALWHSDDTTGQVSLLWQDPKMDGWKHHESYIFKIEFRGSLNRMRLKIQQGEEVLSDSGYLYDTTSAGGRVGVYTHGQANVIWSRLTVKCFSRMNKAMLFNGVNSTLTLPSMTQLKVDGSFVLMLWFKLTSGFTNAVYPLICNNVVANTLKSFCLFVKDSTLQARLSSTPLNSGNVLSADTWYNVAVRWDQEGECEKTTYTCEKKLVVFLNGNEIKSSVVGESSLNYDDVLYVGYDGENYFKGTIDEVSVWNAYMKNDEIKANTQNSGLQWPIHRRLVTAFYDVDQNEIGSHLENQSEYEHNATLSNIQIIESNVDYARLQLL